jgi:hypothetical protein
VQSGIGALCRILSRCRRANRHRAPHAETPQGVKNVPTNGCRDGHADKDRAEAQRRVPHLLPTHLVERLAAQLGLDHTHQAPCLDKALVRHAGDAKAIRHADADLRQASQFGGFATNPLLGPLGNLCQRNDATRWGL